MRYQGKNWAGPLKMIILSIFKFYLLLILEIKVAHKFLIFSGWSREKKFKGCWFHRLPATLRGCCWFWQLLSESSHTGVLQPKKCAQSVRVTDIYVRAAAAFFGAHTFFFKTPHQVYLLLAPHIKHCMAEIMGDWRRKRRPGRCRNSANLSHNTKIPDHMWCSFTEKTPLVCFQICKNQTDFFRSRKV